MDRLGHGYAAGQWLFRDYTLRIEAGSVCAVLGPNGRGKSTLLKCLLGVLRPREGTVAVGARSAFVPQLFQVGFPFSAIEVVLMGRARHVGLFSVPSRADESVARDALARVGLDGLAQRRFDDLSGGQRQLVLFARALASGAGVLVLDEPASALDLRNQRLVLDRIDRLRTDEKLTVVMTTHHPHHALAIADAALLMLQGGGFAFGPAGGMLTEPNLRELYGIDVRRIGFEHRGRRLETLVPVLRD
jgi:iron complex transport system ATP-binding protein